MRNRLRVHHSSPRVAEIVSRAEKWQRFDEVTKAHPELGLFRRMARARILSPDEIRHGLEMGLLSLEDTRSGLTLVADSGRS